VEPFEGKARDKGKKREAPGKRNPESPDRTRRKALGGREGGADRTHEKKGPKWRRISPDRGLSRE